MDLSVVEKLEKAAEVVNLTPLHSLTKQGRRVAENRYGFRDETLYGEGYIDFKEVLEHETIELANTDIYECMMKNYGLDLPYGEIPETEEEVEKTNQVIFSFVSEKLGTDQLYCKWLCGSAEDVNCAYDSNVEYVTRWDMNGKFMLVSDCCIDGVLVVSDKMITERA